MEKLTYYKRLKERHEMITMALETLNESIKLFNESKDDPKYYVALRNSIIKSFEYTMDTFWKFLKEYLECKCGVEPLSSPKSIFRKCFDVKIMTVAELETTLEIVEARNLTSHTYNSDLAEEICHDIPKYYQLMKKIIDRIDINSK